jgi:hypothetical protein
LKRALSAQMPNTLFHAVDLKVKIKLIFFETEMAVFLPMGRIQIIIGGNRKCDQRILNKEKLAEKETMKI